MCIPKKGAETGLACKDQGRFAADWLGVHPPWDELGEEQRRTDELESRLVEVTQSMTSQDEVLQELVARRITLREAAARFRALARQTRSFSWELFRLTYPGRTDEERHCRHVIALTAM